MFSDNASSFSEKEILHLAFKLFHSSLWEGLQFGFGWLFLKTKIVK